MLGKRRRARHYGEQAADEQAREALAVVCLRERARTQRPHLTEAMRTAEQAEVAARRVRQMPPDYERVALERMYHAETRARSGLQ